MSRIIKVGIEVYDLELIEPYTIAYETLDKVSNVVLRIDTSDGLSGWGCAAPDRVITGENAKEVVETTVRWIAPLLEGSDPFAYQRLMHEAYQNPDIGKSALAMMDMALADVLARKAKLPLFKLFGAFRYSIPTSITVGIMPLEETLDRVEKYCADGFFAIKIKGGLDVEGDIEKLKLIRERFPKEIVLRFDANQGYSNEEALYFLDNTRELSIEIFEQPTRFGQDENLGFVTRNSAIPVMGDESIRSLADAFRLAREEHIDMVNIKLQKIGGFNQAFHINSVARAAGLEVMTGCLDECGMGISAGLHFSLSRPNVEYADLDGHLDMKDDPFHHLVNIVNGVMYPTDHPGLGKIL